MQSVGRFAGPRVKVLVDQFLLLLLGLCLDRLRMQTRASSCTTTASTATRCLLLPYHTHFNVSGCYDDDDDQ